MSSSSPQAVRSTIPEAAGPGDEHPNGSVTFGQPVLPRIHVERRRDPAEVARERAGAQHRCDFCRDIPAEVLASLRQALDSKTEARR
jgi:hypothetical protein